MIQEKVYNQQAEIDAKKAAAVREYPALWQRVTAEWARQEESDRAWLLYSANYLFRTAGFRWALDPLRLCQRLPSAPEMDASALTGLEAVVLTHAHGDHFDRELLARLRNNSLRWIVPEFLLGLLRGLGIPGERVTIARSLETISLGGLTLTPFNGLHWEAVPERPEGLRGIPAMGYLVEFSGKRWLFPGDVRTYDPGRIPYNGPLDGIFAHLWLGRGSALSPEPHLLEAFCSFHLAFKPGRLVITHLDEFARQPGEYWHERHFQAVRAWFAIHAPGVAIQPAGHGDCVEL